LRIPGRGINPWHGITRQDPQPGIRNTLARHHRTTFVLFKIKENLHQINRLVVSVIKVIIIITVHHTTSHYNTLQYTESSSHYNSLQHVATHCNTLQHTETHCETLHHHLTKSHAKHCNTLQLTATHCNTPQHIATNCIIIIPPKKSTIWFDSKTWLILH